MNQTPKLGLGNALDENTEILHTGILGRVAFGRICDLVSVWTLRRFPVGEKHLSDLRIVVHALLDFAHPTAQVNPGQLEFSIESDMAFASVRFENRIFESTESVEKSISQYWLNSEDVAMLKKVLHARDRVEVRFNDKLNLVEWRVCRSLKPGTVSPNDVSFAVLLDHEPTLLSEHKRYTEMGDLPYQDWLSEVYRNNSNESRSGEFFVKGESLQNESEWARVVSDRELQEAEAEVSFQSGEKTPSDRKFVFKATVHTADDEKEIQTRSEQHLEELRLQLLLEKAELKESVKVAITESKKKELSAIREAELTRQKVSTLETIMRKKELAIQKSQSEMKQLQAKIQKLEKAAQAEQSKGTFTIASQVGVAAGTAAVASSPRGTSGVPSNVAEAFKEKAMQMFEKLKEVKKENELLEQRLLEFQRGQFESGGEQPAFSNNLQIDELSKKLDRTQRALEAEKNKVKSLSERVTTAEREAQSSAPIIEDLERKVETTLKTAQQHKKETELVKQKLVQAEAEKNKVKNELVKVQAEVKTLQKRHAS